ARNSPLKKAKKTHHIKPAARMIPPKIHRKGLIKSLRLLLELIIPRGARPCKSRNLTIIPKGCYRVATNSGANPPGRWEETERLLVSAGRAELLSLRRLDRSTGNHPDRAPDGREVPKGLWPKLLLRSGMP